MPDTPPPLPNPVQPGPGVFAGQASQGHEPPETRSSTQREFKKSPVTLGGNATVRASRNPSRPSGKPRSSQGGLTRSINNVLPSARSHADSGAYRRSTSLAASSVLSQRACHSARGRKPHIQIRRRHTPSRRTTPCMPADRISRHRARRASCRRHSSRPSDRSGRRSRADAVLERSVENGSVPPECENLLRETDPPGSVGRGKPGTGGNDPGRSVPAWSRS